MGIVKATVQAATLSATSNILAQALKSYRADRPLSLDPTQIFQFIIFALLNTPPNFLWQAFLEDTFPAYAPTTSRSSAATDITTDTDTGISLTATVKRSPTGGSPQIVFEKTSEVPLNASGEVVPNKAGKKKLNIRNTAMKFALDQTVGALVNTVVFIAVMSAFRGVGRAQIMGMVQQDSWPLMKAGYKLWPIVSLLSFTVVPVQQRVVFGSLVGVGWGIFLSLFAGH